MRMAIVCAHLAILSVLCGPTTGLPDSGSTSPFLTKANPGISLSTVAILLRHTIHQHIKNIATGLIKQLEATNKSTAKPRIDIDRVIFGAAQRHVVAALDSLDPSRKVPAIRATIRVQPTLAANYHALAQPMIRMDRNAEAVAIWHQALVLSPGRNAQPAKSVRPGQDSSCASALDVLHQSPSDGDNRMPSSAAKVSRDFCNFDCLRSVSAAAQASFLQKQVAIVRHCLSPLQLRALRGHAFGVFTEGRVPHGDVGNLLLPRYKDRGDRVVAFIHQQLTPMINLLTGQTFRPTFNAVVKYVGGSKLPIHNDDKDSGTAVTLPIAASFPTSRGGPTCNASCWPLHVLTQAPDATSSTVSLDLAEGDMGIYDGEHLDHYREVLPAGATYIALLFHYTNSTSIDNGQAVREMVWRQKSHYILYHNKTKPRPQKIWESH